MAFNSSIMLAENTINSKNSLLDKSNMTESYIYTMLEFNDDFHIAEINERKIFYKELTKASTCEYINESETTKASISEKLSYLIHVIVDFIKKFINLLTQKDIKIRSKYKHLASTTDGFKIPSKNNENFVFTLYHFPYFNDIDDQKCRSSITNIINEINSICNGKSVQNINNEQTAYGILGTICQKNASRHLFIDPIDNSASFSNFVRSDIIYKEKKELSYKKWNNLIKDIVPTKKDVVIKKASSIKNDLEMCEKRIKEANLTDTESLKNAKTLIGQIKNIVSSWTWYLNAIYDFETSALAYIMNTYNRLNSSVNESGQIHGEPFDSDTLFDNEDMRDFNPTEWMNLELTTEGFNIKYEIDEFNRIMAIKEAMIFSDDEFNKFNRLKAIREAESNNLDNNIKAIIASIKEIANKFFNKVNNMLNLNKKYIDQYSDTIKNKPFAKSTPECTSKGDILAGIGRVNTPFKPEPFNFDLMKDDLKDKNIFFEKRILPKLNASSNYSKTKNEWKNGETSIVDYCKSYFGASMPEVSCKFTGTELDALKNNIIEFVTESKSMISNIKSQLNSIDNESRKVTSKITRTQNTKETADKTENKNNDKNTSTKSESMYYSSLYDRYLTEIEITSGEPLNNENDSNNNSDTNNESSAFRVYYDAYKDVLMSQLTAAEFIISELMKVIHHHVDYYTGKIKPKKSTEK